MPYSLEGNVDLRALSLNQTYGAPRIARTSIAQPQGDFRFDPTGGYGGPAPPPQLPTGGGPGAMACALVGLGPYCTWAEAAIAGAGKLAGRGGGGEPPSAGPCGTGMILVGDKCVDITAALPGGDPFMQDIGAEMGVFGLLSTGAVQVGEINGRPVRRCPYPGLVLGKDNRCYSKRDLPRSARKWRPSKRLCATDKKIKAIKSAGAAARSLTKTFKGSGYKITKAGRR